ncbi:MAG: LysR family transcriptional regulator [Acidobacteriaceae bacterium]
MIQSRQIEAFRAVMLTGAMTSAAKAIHVSQPAISRLVRDLEAELGLSLFGRRGNSVVPTAEAHSLMAEVERHFTGLAHLRSVADDIRAGRRASLRIAALPAMAAGFAPRFVAAFCRRRPNLKVSIEGLPSSVIRDGVTTGHYDVGMTAFPFNRDSLVVYPLEDAAVVAMPTDHRLARRKTVKVQDLRDENFVALSKSDTHPIHNILQAVRRRQALDTQLSMIACVLVLEGMGIAIVDPFSASEYIERGLVVRPLEPAMTIGTAVVCSRGRPLSAIAQSFLDEFLEHSRQFLARAEYCQS